MAENLLEEVRAENFPHMWKKTDIQIQGAQRPCPPPSKFNSRRFTPRHIIIKRVKSSHKEKKMFKAARKKKIVTFIDTHKAINGFSAETLQARREYGMIFSKY